MLEVTGTFKGEAVTAKAVTAAEVAKELGINLPLGRLSFELDRKSKGTVTVNQADGQERFSRQRNFAPVARGHHNGNTLEIRYYTSKTQTKDGPKYRPSRVEYLGDKHTVDASGNPELALIFVCLPACSDSPIRGRNSQPHYKIRNKQAEAHARIRRDEDYDILRGAVLKMPSAFAMALAKGISHETGVIPNDHTETEVEAKAALLDLARSNPELLQKSMSSTRAIAAGTVLEAQSQGAIECVPDNSGRHVWKMSEANGGELLFKVPKGKPVLDTFIPEAMGEELLAKIRASIGAQGGPLEDLPPSNVIERAITEGVVIFKPDESKCYIMEGGHLQGKALRVIEDPANWKQELMEKANENMAARVLKSMK